MLILVLIGLTSCQTVKADINEVDLKYKKVLKSLTPEPPALPSFPTLTLKYENGNYCFDEADIDKLIIFRDESLVNFNTDFELYVYKVSKLIENL